jgi:hypothetical protein
MPPRIKFTKQYKPIVFGDRPDPGTVEGHLNAIEEAAETRRYNKRMKELEAQDAGRRGGPVSKVLGFLRAILKTVLANLDSLREFKAN